MFSCWEICRRQIKRRKSFLFKIINWKANCKVCIFEIFCKSMWSSESNDSIDLTINWSLRRNSFCFFFFNKLWKLTKKNIRTNQYGCKFGTWRRCHWHTLPTNHKWYEGEFTTVYDHLYFIRIGNILLQTENISNIHLVGCDKKSKKIKKQANTERIYLRNERIDWNHKIN